MPQRYQTDRIHLIDLTKPEGWTQIATGNGSTSISSARIVQDIADTLNYHDALVKQRDEMSERAAHWERLHDNRTRELNELNSKIADIARRIGPARLPGSIRNELERLTAAKQS